MTKKLWDPGTRIAGKYNGKPYTGVVDSWDFATLSYLVDLDEPFGASHQIQIGGPDLNEARLVETEADLFSEPTTSDAPEPILADLMQQYHDAQQVVADTKAKRKEAKEKAGAIRAQILEQMDANRLQNLRVKLHDGSSPLAYRTTSEKPRATDQRAVVAWCEGMGINPAMFYQWSPQKFGAFWKERNAEGLSMPPGVDVYREEDVRFRKG